MSQPISRIYPFPVLSVSDRHSQYQVPCSWIAWLPNASPTPGFYTDSSIVGVQTFGPQNTVVGTSAYLVGKQSQANPARIQLHWVHPTEPAPPQLPASLTILGSPALPLITRKAPMTLPESSNESRHPIRWLQSLVLPQSIQPDPPDAAIHDHRIIAHWDAPDTWPDTVWLWLQDLPIPLDASWKASILRRITQPQSGVHAERLPEWRSPAAQGAPTLIQLRGLERFESWIQEGLRQQAWTIPEGFGPNPAIPFQNLETPDEYLTAWAPALAQQLATVVQPRVTAGQPIPDAWRALLRQPFFPAQSDIIQASTATLDAPDGPPGIIIQGETGTGKSLMMSIIPWDQAVRVHQRPGFRVLVIAPDHLLQKWAREILTTIPEATTHPITSWEDVLRQREHWHTTPTHPEYWILGRDRGKLSYRTEFAAQWSPRHHAWQCPDCGTPLTDLQSGLGWPKKVTRIKRYRQCPACHTPLWSATGRPRRVSPMHLLRRVAAHCFDTVICDELQELLGESEQGQMLAWSLDVGRQVILGTGTLSNGYVTGLHMLQYRIDPRSMLADGIGYADTTETQHRYGRVQTKRIENHENPGVYGRRSSSRKYEKVLPGISPLWYATKLVDKMLVIQLEDLGANALPPYEESVHWIPMEPDQAAWHTSALTTIRQTAVAALKDGSRRLLSQLLTQSLTLPDASWRTLRIHDAHNDVMMLTPPETLTEDRVYPKERQIVADVQDELAQGRRVWIYTTFTRKYPQADRLYQQLTAAGIRTTILASDTVSRGERERWIAEQVRHGIQVIISHPQLVETGLDNYHFPSIFWNSTGYVLSRLRQASRRAWRIGQTEPCLVRFYAYAETMEQQALTLMAQKLEAARILESNMSLAGLQRIAESEGDSNQLVRALIEHGLAGAPDVSQVWRVIQQDQRERPPQISIPTSAADIPPVPPNIPMVLAMANVRTGRHPKPAPASAQQLAWALFTE